MPCALKMDRFVIRTPIARSDQHGTLSDSDPEDGESLEPPSSKVLASSASSSSAMKSKTYKSKISYGSTKKIFVQYKNASFQHVLSRLIENSEIATAFPNLARLAAIVEVLPVTTAVVERSSMELDYKAGWVKIPWIVPCSYILRAQILFLSRQ